jgi:hypothetical protein
MIPLSSFEMKLNGEPGPPILKNLSDRSDKEIERRGGSMFYTDTNGHMPEQFSTALVILGILMKSTPLDEIDFEIFNDIAKDIDRCGRRLMTEE